MAAKLDIDSLRALKTIAYLGGVTRAAEALSLSQSAVSHKIRRLEDGIGRRLLQRQAGAPLLTEDGERLLTYAGRILVLHDEALSALGQDAMTGQIRLGVTEDTTGIGLARILARFSRLHPGVSVKTHVAQTLALQKQLDAGRIDLAVMQVFSGDAADDDTILDVDQLCWVQGLDFDAALCDPAPFIAFDADCIYRHWAMQATKAGARIETVLECASIEGVRSAVVAGLGVALVNRRNMRSGMRRIESRFPTPPEIAYVLRRRPGVDGRAVEALATEIANEFAIGKEIRAA